MIFVFILTVYVSFETYANEDAIAAVGSHNIVRTDRDIEYSFTINKPKWSSGEDMTDSQFKDQSRWQLRVWADRLPEYGGGTVKLEESNKEKYDHWVRARTLPEIYKYSKVRFQLRGWFGDSLLFPKPDNVANDSDFSGYVTFYTWMLSSAGKEVRFSSNDGSKNSDIRVYSQMRNCPGGNCDRCKETNQCRPEGNNVFQWDSIGGGQFKNFQMYPGDIFQVKRDGKFRCLTYNQVVNANQRHQPSNRLLIQQKKGENRAPEFQDGGLNDQRFVCG